MSNRHDYNNSYELEKLLSQSIDRMRENTEKQHKLKRQIVKLRRQRRQLEAVPDEVKQWFEDTEGLDEDEQEQQ